jgi:long-chain acyl-CoA synthetase
MEDQKVRVSLDGPALDDRLAAAAMTGMTAAVWADVKPNAPFIYDPDGKVTTFGEVNAAANRIVRLLRQHGLKAGDAVALVCSNRAEFVDVLIATRRAGLRVTPVNWHLTADEIGYIISDCEAKAVFCERRITASAAAAAQAPNVRVKVAIGGPIDGFLDWDAALAGLDPSDIDDPVLGNQMMYTSGTTGRPKGVYRAQAVVPMQAIYAMRGYDHETSAQLCAGPAYHAAPLAFDVGAAMGAA